MKIERRVVLPNVVQITLEDERWYFVEDPPPSRYLPSTSWIASYYPKGAGFNRWLAAKGWDAAEAIKFEAGDKGSRIHHAIASLLNGNAVAHDAKFSANGEPATELNADEYGAVMSFVDWYESFPCPRCKKKGCLSIVAHDYVVIGDGYAGTVDAKMARKCDNSRGIVDFKTSKAVYESHRAQVQAYRRADPDTKGRTGWAAILQVGYAANKAGYKFTLIPPSDWQLFVTARRIWADQTKGAKPLQRDFPLELKLKGVKA